MVEKEPGRRDVPAGQPPFTDGSAAVPFHNERLAAPSLRDEVSALPLFHSMPAERLSFLLRGAERRSFEKGEEIRTPDDKVYIVLSGVVDCVLRDAADSEFRLGFLPSGAPVGELSHFVPASEKSHDGKVRIAAHTALSIVSFPAGPFVEAVVSTPESARTLLSIFAARISGMNRFANQAVDVNLNPDRVKATTLNERLADFVTSKLGSFRFLAGIAVASGAWMVANIGFMVWDPYPYVFLNLIFSVMSASTTSILLISQNRQSQLDRVKARVGQRVLMRIARQVDTLTTLVEDAERERRGAGETFPKRAEPN